MRSLPRFLPPTVALPVLLLLAAAPIPAQTVRYVNATATGAGNGQTWADAYTSLQDALAAAGGGQIQEIWVARGTYAPAGSGGDRTASFRLINGVSVLGGFAGTENRRDDRDPWGNPTILTGDLNGNDDAQIQASTADNAYHVLTGSGTDATAVLDGFVITGGAAAAVAFPNDVGGGLINLTGSPTIVDCIFRGNVADFAGGAVYNQESTARLIHCVFEANRANDRGGAIYNTFDSACLINRCTFAANNASSGGAIHNSGASPTVVNSVFTGNSGTAGGALFNNGGSMSLINCTLTMNIVAYIGGGLYTADGDPSIRNCIFWDNRDVSGMDESAQIARVGGSPVVTHSCVQGGWTGLGGTGNIASDPLFVDPDGPDQTVGTADDDLRLTGSSSGVNAGDNLAIPSGVTVDLAGHPRVSAAVVDMGAFEFAGSASPDFDGDEDVDRDDLAFFEDCQTGPALGPPTPQCLPTDLDGDGDVDQVDYGVLQRALEPG